MVSYAPGLRDLSVRDGPVHPGQFLPWQVAFVYDPSSGEEGAFVWRAGASEREPFLIQEDTIEEIQAKPNYEWQPPNQPTEPPPKDPYSTGRIWALAIFAFLASFMVALLFVWKY